MPDVPYTFNPSSFGNFLADGSLDASAALQAALNAASTSTASKIVRCPPGSFKFSTGRITIPAGVTLEAANQVRPGFPGEENSQTSTGTLFLVTVDQGSPLGTPFCQLNNNSAIRGIEFYYPNQSQTASSPLTYPFTIAGTGSTSGSNPGVDVQDVLIEDIHLRNSYQGIDLTHCPEHQVHRITGQPLFIGILVDECFDTCWISDIQFFPFWGFNAFTSDNITGAVDAPAVGVWVQNHGTAMIFQRSDDQRCDRCSLFGYKYGMHFYGSSDNGLGTNGCFQSIRCEISGTAGIFIEGGANVNQFSGLRFYDVEPGAVQNGTGIHVASNFTGGLARFFGGNVVPGVAGGGPGGFVDPFAPVVIEAGNVLLNGMYIQDQSTTLYSVRVTGGIAQINNCLFGKANKHISANNSGTLVLINGCTATGGNTLDVSNGTATVVTGGNH